MPPWLQQAQAHAAREAGRAQLADALQHQLAEAAASLEGGNGACALATGPDAQLACDNEHLSLALAPRAAALAGLLQAYRSMEPRTAGLAIAVVQGRYQVSWNIGETY
jgi:hypothetical protein